MNDVFLSYSNKDSKRIEPLIKILEGRGLSVFWDRHIEGGQRWRKEIFNALNNAKCVVVAWSKNSIASEWVIEEAEFGKRKRILVPIKIDLVEPPFGFREIQTSDLISWKNNRKSEEFNKFFSSVVDLVEDNCTNINSNFDEIRVNKNINILRKETLFFALSISSILILGYYYQENISNILTKYFKVTTPVEEKFYAGHWEGEITSDFIKYKIDLNIGKDKKQLIEISPFSRCTYNLEIQDKKSIDTSKVKFLALSEETVMEKCTQSNTLTLDKINKSKLGYFVVDNGGGASARGVLSKVVE